MKMAMERPLSLLLGAMISGLVFAWLTGKTLPTVILPSLLILAVLSLLSQRQLFLNAAITFLCFAWGVLALQPSINPLFSSEHIFNRISFEPIKMEGVVVCRPEKNEHGYRMQLQVERFFRGEETVPATGRVMLYVGNGEPFQLSGDRLRFSAKLRKPRTLGLPGEFNIVSWLALQDIYVTAYVQSSGELLLMRRGVAFPLQRRIDAVAVRLGGFISSRVGAVEGGILRALLLGEMGYVPKDIKDAYTRTGINHILSISGFHVGVVALVVFQLFLQAARLSATCQLYCNVRKAALVCTMPVVIFYMLLSGAAPATVRSVIMLLVFLVAMLMERVLDPINSLIVAAMAILSITPAALFNISFQLSFLALWGIIVLTPFLISPFRNFKLKPLKALLLLVMASAAATVATMPPVIFYFHRATVIGLIGNLVAVPLMGYGAVVLGFIGLSLSQAVPFLASAFIQGGALLIMLTNKVINQLASLPLLPFIAISRWQLLFFYLLLTVITFERPGRLRFLFSLFIVGAFIGCGIAANIKKSDDLTVTFFSIGQGDATLVTFPSGRRMLIDGGGSFRENAPDTGERFLAPALWAKGIDRIDYLVLSHPHPDHLKGLAFLAANFKVGEFWEGEASSGSADYIAFKKILAEKGVACRRGAAGVPSEPLVEVELISAGSDQMARTPDLPVTSVNEASMVFRIKSGGFAVLFTGDIGRETEKRLTQRQDQLKCTILKVPHHGSRHSLSITFLDAALPEVAVISAGYGNSFALPAASTLSTLHSRGIRAIRTDLDGTIEASCRTSSYSWELHKIAAPFSLTSF